MSKTIRAILKNHWFEEIKTGRKTHEYRRVTPFWIKRIENAFNMKAVTFENNHIQIEMPEEYMPVIEFQKAFYKNPERMTFKIKRLTVINGLGTDLNIDGAVFDIELGERVL